MASLNVAGVAYLLACREVFRGRCARSTPAFPRRVVIFGLVLAAVWHVAAYPGNPEFEQPGYPPGAQLFCRVVTAVHESTSALKFAFVFCAFAVAFVLLHVLRQTGQGAYLVLAYVWNPLLAIEVVSQ